jgi:hypothetical protein
MFPNPLYGKRAIVLFGSTSHSVGGNSLPARWPLFEKRSGERCLAVLEAGRRRPSRSAPEQKSPRGGAGVPNRATKEWGIGSALARGDPRASSLAAVCQPPAPFFRAVPTSPLPR